MYTLIDAQHGAVPPWDRAAALDPIVAASSLCASVLPANGRSRDSTTGKSDAGGVHAPLPRFTRLFTRTVMPLLTEFRSAPESCRTVSDMRTGLVDVTIRVPGTCRQSCIIATVEGLTERRECPRSSDCCPSRPRRWASYSAATRRVRGWLPNLWCHPDLCSCCT